MQFSFSCCCCRWPQRKNLMKINWHIFLSIILLNLFINDFGFLCGSNLLFLICLLLNLFLGSLLAENTVTISDKHNAKQNSSTSYLKLVEDNPYLHIKKNNRMISNFKKENYERFKHEQGTIVMPCLRCITLYLVILYVIKINIPQK